jgi:hypothetical protein
MILFAYHSSVELRPIVEINNIYPPLEIKKQKKMRSVLNEYTGPS